MAIEHFIPLYARQSKDEDGKLREINLDVPEVREKLDRLMDAKLKYTRPFGLHGYSLGHESSLSHVESSTHVVDYDFSEPTLTKFRSWLKARYKSIAALNESWGARHQSLDEIVPKTYAESRNDRANLAPWMEHRKFMDEDFTSWLTYCADRIRKIDPKARVGITGIAGG